MSSDPPLVAQVGLAAPRVAVVLDGGPAWHYWARLAIHTASRLWGGRGFLLVPHVDGVVDPVLLRAARTYDPDYVMRFPASVGQLEHAGPGGPLLIDGQLVEGAERAEALKDLAADVAHEDPAGEMARDAVVRACSPYRRPDPSGYNADLEQVVLADLGHTPSPLTPLSAIPKVAGGPFLTAPPTWGGPLGVIAAASCGLFAEPENGEPPVIEEDDREVLLRWLLFDIHQINRVGVPEPLLKWMLSPDNHGSGGTAFQRTAYGLSQISEARGRQHPALFVVGDTAADFAAAYAHRLLYGDGWWLPAELSPCGNDERATLMRRLLHDGVVNEFAARQGRVAVTSVSADTGAVDAVVHALRVPTRRLKLRKGQDTQQALITAVVRTDPVFPVGGAMSYAVTTDLDHPVSVPAAIDADGTITLLAPVPVPDTSDPGLRACDELTWQVEVRLEGPGMPAGRDLAGASLLVDDTDPHLIRSSRHGPRFESHRDSSRSLGGRPRLSRLARPRLKVLSPYQWAERVARQQQHTIRVSDAGRRAEVLASVLGGRAPLAGTFSGPMVAALREFLSDKPTSRERYPGHEGVVLHAAGTNDAGYEGYLTFDGMTSFAPHPNLLTELDELIERGLLTRGLIVNCGLCARVAFVSLDAAGRIITCLRCGARNPLTSARWNPLSNGGNTRPLTAPAWFFDLHPVARDLLRANGEVPLQLAAHPRSQVRHYIDAPELELCETAGPAIAEIDLLAYADGQVIVAEAKNSRTLGIKPAVEVKKKMTAADMLQADQIIFATSAPNWERASLSAIQSGVRTGRSTHGRTIDVRIITGLGTASCEDRRMSPDGKLTDW